MILKINKNEKNQNEKRRQNYQKYLEMRKLCKHKGTIHTYILSLLSKMI